MYKASVITISDRASRGEYEDKSGALIRDMLKKAGYGLSGYVIIPDEKNRIKEAIIEECDNGVELIVTTGGTGFAPGDVTPEATREVIEREAPGISEYMRQR